MGTIHLKTVPLIYFLVCFMSVESYFVIISQNGPVVRGANITFKAELFNSYGQPAEGSFRYNWKDNAIPQHSVRVESTMPVSEWVISFPSSVYAPGTYEVEVSVEKFAIFYWPVCSQRALFNVTAMLNGEMVVSQGNSSVPGKFVSSAKEAVHEVQLTRPDSDFVLRNATSILTYWFIDCVYYGFTSDFSFHFNYSIPDTSHSVEALVVISYEPPTTTTSTTTTTTTPTTTTPTTPPTTTTPTTPPTTTTPTTPPTTTTPTTPPTTTTPTTPPTTTTPTTTTTMPTTTTIAPNIPTTTITSVSNFSSNSQSSTIQLPFVCGSTSVMPDPKKSYGLFSHRLVAKAPVADVEVSGSNWLQHGDMVNLTVVFSGSLNFTHCIQPKQAGYNVTGHETCKNYGTLLRERKFQVIHYFRFPGTYVLLMIVSNDINKVVYPVTINIYEVTKHAQLSVIVVPVTCSLLAVILVVFGVAYYVQSRNRYTVEVADFDFGQVSDMEYKTFRERLKESVMNSINRPGDYLETNNIWSPSRKYGSMQ